MTLSLFTHDERLEISRALDAIGVAAARVPGLDDLLSKWDTFVSEVESGYRMTIYDYTNDLATRDWLEGLIGSVEDPLAHKLREALRRSDNRFEVATEPAAKPLKFKAPTARIWWHRVPRRRIDELKDDLESDGYTPTTQT